jgi:hypothetical protein
LGVCGDDERCKVASLFKAGAEVLRLLLAFMLEEDFCGWLVALQFIIDIRDSNVNDAIGTALPKALDK